MNTYVDSDMELPDKTLDCHATDITIYTWNNANELTGATHYNNYSDYEAGTCTATNEYAITYGNDAFGQMVTRTAAIGTGTSTTTTTENFIYNGQNIALVLDQYGSILERELTGTAADQVFATESVVSGLTNWYLTDNQGTVRDVAQGVSSGGTMTADVVDHVIYTAFGAPSQARASPARRCRGSGLMECVTTPRRASSSPPRGRTIRTRALGFSPTRPVLVRAAIPRSFATTARRISSIPAGWIPTVRPSLGGRLIVATFRSDCCFCFPAAAAPVGRLGVATAAWVGAATSAAVTASKRLAALG